MGHGSAGWAFVAVLRRSPLVFFFFFEPIGAFVKVCEALCFLVDVPCCSRFVFSLRKSVDRASQCGDWPVASCLATGQRGVRESLFFFFLALGCLFGCLPYPGSSAAGRFIVRGGFYNPLCSGSVPAGRCSVPTGANTGGGRPVALFSRRDTL